MDSDGNRLNCVESGIQVYANIYIALKVDQFTCPGAAGRAECLT